jgi:uncharacterized protein (DUF2141 family)
MLLYFLSIVLMGLSMNPAATSTLTVEITNIKSTGGHLRVALYKPTNEFGSAKPDYHKVHPVPVPGSLRVAFNVPPGTYALAIYHDLNSNGKLDKNLVGYPKEPFGFSNNYRPLLSAPKFHDCAFELTEQGASLTIKLFD